GNRKRPNRRDLLALEDRLESCSVVVGFPHTAVASRNVEGIKVSLSRRLRHRNICDPRAGAKRSEISVGESTVQHSLKVPGFVASQWHANESDREQSNDESHHQLPTVFSEINGAHKSFGCRPVCLAIRASIFGPISSLSWKANTTAGQPARESILCELDSRLMVQPIRSNAARTRP